MMVRTITIIVGDVDVMVLELTAVFGSLEGRSVGEEQGEEIPKRTRSLRPVGRPNG